MEDLFSRLDPQLKNAANATPMVVPDTVESLRIARTMSPEMLQDMQPVSGVAQEDRTVPGPAGAPDVPVRLYRPEELAGKTLPALLWLHGGGYILGDIDMDDPRCSRLSREAGCLVASVSYRLAPEDPYPAPLEDCYAALQWLAANTHELGVDGSRIAVGGSSAGGGLAAALALLNRDRAGVPLVLQLLVYPMIDDANVLPPAEGRPDSLFWTRAANLTGWRWYLGCEPGSDGIECYAAAARADDLHNLPPACIAVGDLDLFAEEDVAYAGRLITAGIPVELHVYPGAPHGFDLMAPEADVSRRFTADIHHAVRRALRG